MSARPTSTLSALEFKDLLRQAGIARLSSKYTHHDGWTYRDFARLANLLPQQVDRWVNGAAAIPGWIPSWLWMWRRLSAHEKNDLRRAVGLIPEVPGAPNYIQEAWYQRLNPPERYRRRGPRETIIQCENCERLGARYVLDQSKSPPKHVARCVACHPVEPGEEAASNIMDRAELGDYF